MFWKSKIMVLSAFAFVASAAPIFAEEPSGSSASTVNDRLNQIEQKLDAIIETLRVLAATQDGYMASKMGDHLFAVQTKGDREVPIVFSVKGTDGKLHLAGLWNLQMGTSSGIEKGRFALVQKGDLIEGSGFTATRGQFEFKGTVSNADDTLSFDLKYADGRGAWGAKDASYKCTAKLGKVNSNPDKVHAYAGISGIWKEGESSNRFEAQLVKPKP